MHTTLTAEPVMLSAALPVRVERVRREPRARAPARFAHFHPVAEIVLFEDVAGVMHTENERFDLAAGCVTWAPAWSAHDFALAGGAASWTLIHFYQDFAQVQLHPAPVCATFRSPDRRRVRSLLTFLSEAVDAGALHEARRYLELILLTIDRAYHREGVSTAPTHALSRFRPLLDRLRATPCTKLSLSQAASLCHLSPAYFSRLFREVFGRGFADYMMQLQLDRAAVALASSREPVSSVGFHAGFNSHAYFTARFRKRFGRTPTEFRRQSSRGEG